MTPVNELKLDEEAVLDPTIRFDNSRSRASAPPTHIFLTGATGFLGAYLLDDLLRQTSADVSCLIRGESSEAAQQRLEHHLQSLGLWQEAWRSRLAPVAGDLAQPLFGLSEAQFSDLAACIDVIYHNGGLINFVRPYPAFKGANVSGTHEVLRLAGLSHTKPIHFTSTISVFFSDTYTQRGYVSETDIPVYDAGLKGGYKRSKWVAEQLIFQAQERGLPASIYRPIRIAGHSCTGMTSQTDDLLNSLIKSCILMEAYLDFEIDIPLVPVDYVSRAMVHLSQQNTSLGKAFHLFHPQPIAWRELVGIIRDFGYPLAEMDEKQWRRELRQRGAKAAVPHQQLYARLRMLLSLPNNLFIPKPQYDAPHTREGLAGTSIMCPLIDRSLLSTYFSYFQDIGYLPVPPVQTGDPLRVDV